MRRVQITSNVCLFYFTQTGALSNGADVHWSNIPLGQMLQEVHLNPKQAGLH